MRGKERNRGVHRRPGFTLVEILIVVVIIGILATLVIPLMAGASTDALKAALQRQLQTVTHQIELYKANNANELPTNNALQPVGGVVNQGWGILVSDKYLKDIPYNGYTDAGLMVAGAEAAAIALVPSSDTGWFFEITGSAQMSVYAAGFDAANNALSNE